MVAEFVFRGWIVFRLGLGDGVAVYCRKYFHLILFLVIISQQRRPFSFIDELQAETPWMSVLLLSSTAAVSSSTPIRFEDLSLLMHRPAVWPAPCIKYPRTNLSRLSRVLCFLYDRKGFKRHASMPWHHQMASLLFKCLIIYCSKRKG